MHSVQLNKFSAKLFSFSILYLSLRILQMRDTLADKIFVAFGTKHSVLFSVYEMLGRLPSKLSMLVMFSLLYRGKCSYWKTMCSFLQLVQGQKRKRRKKRRKYCHANVSEKHVCEFGNIEV